MTTIKQNNIDKALTPKPEPDVWDEPAEKTEKTVSATLISGMRADTHYAPSHEVGRQLRTKRRGWTAEEPATNANWRIALQELDAPFDHLAVIEKLQNGQDVDYWEFLEAMKAVTKGKKTPMVDIDEWRPVPGFPHYFMHSQTRELRKEAHEKTLPNGNVRRYKAKSFTPANGSYNLTADGVSSSRGVNALWSEVFPEFGRKKKRKKGEWDDTIVPRHDPYIDGNGVREWMHGEADEFD